MTSTVEAMPVKQGFWSGVGSVAKTVCIGIKNGIVWCGRIIMHLFTDYLFPAIKNIWPAIKICFRFIWNFIKTAPGMGTVGCLFATGVGLTFLAIARKDSFKGKKVYRLVLYLFAGFSFLCGAGALAAGLAIGLG